MRTIGRDIRTLLKGSVRYGEPMKRHTSFRIGGGADVWVEPADVDDLRNCMRLAKDRGAPLFVIGEGTNLLISDRGIRGVAVNMRSPSMKSARAEGNGVRVTSSVTLSELSRFCLLEGLSGLEFLSGIPGTVGGALATNAKARHYSEPGKWFHLRDFIEEIKVMDGAGREISLGRKDFDSAPNIPGFKGHVILEAKFLLTTGARNSILNEGRAFLKKKRDSQELGAPSAGCVFKNPDSSGKTAGEMIDACGLKGARIGGAAISRRHANFIINTGRASSDDVISLINLAREKVQEKFDQRLETEIEIV